MEEKDAQYFACLDENNKVITVIVCSSEEIVNFPGRWVETFRDKPGKKYAGINDTYEEAYDDFPNESLIAEWDDQLRAEYGYPPASEDVRPSE
jgi:hypothetical protein